MQTFIKKFRESEPDFQIENNVLLNIHSEHWGCVDPSVLKLAYFIRPWKASVQVMSWKEHVTKFGFEKVFL